MRKYLGSGRYQGAGDSLSEALEMRLTNSPLQERLRYRPGDFTQFRQELLDKVTLDDRLARWTYRGSDDPAVAVLESAATIGEILALYGEVYASEAFLGTARWADSIQDLVRLTGYRLSPPLAGLAEFAFEFKGTSRVTVPAGFGVRAQLLGQEQPAIFETSSEKLCFPSFSSFQLYRPSTPGQGSGRWRILARAQTQRFFFDAANGQKPPVNLAAGDRVMMGVLGSDGKLNGARVHVIEAVDQVLDLTTVTLKGSGHALSLRQKKIMMYKIKDTYRHFGHDAPPSDTTTSGATILYSHWRQTDSETSGLYPARTLVGKAPIIRRPYISPDLAAREYPLDREVNDLIAGETFAIEAPLFTIRPSVKKRKTRPKIRLGLFNKHKPKTRPRLNLGDALRNEFLAHQRKTPLVTHIRTVSSVNAITMTWGTANGASSLVTLNKALATRTSSNLGTTAKIGGIRLHRILGSGMSFQPWLQPTGARGNQLMFYGNVEEAQALVGRRMLVRGENRDDKVLTVTGLGKWHLFSVSSATLRQIYIDQTVNYADFPLEGGALTVNANLVSATQGKTEKEMTIGSGDPAIAFQSFRINRKPLTYLTDTKTTPPEVPQIQVRVNGKLWTCVPSFYGQAPEAMIYVMREDENGFSWVQFGDGITGARPERGTDNITASFRIGSGAHGPMEKGQDPGGVGKLENLKAIRLAGLVTGGTERESAENARIAAPGKVLGLGRIVSLGDVEHELLAIAGVEKVRVNWQIHQDTTALVATVLMEKGRDAELAQVRKTINAYNHSRGSARFPIVLTHGTIAPVYIKLRYGLDPSFRNEDVVAVIQAALGAASEEEETRSGLFALDRRHFGEKEYARTIEAVVAALDGVTWAEVTQLRRAYSHDFSRSFNPFLRGRWRGFTLRIPRSIIATASRARSLICPQNSVFVLDKASLILESIMGEAP